MLDQIHTALWCLSEIILIEFAFCRLWRVKLTV